MFTSFESYDTDLKKHNAKKSRIKAMAALWKDTRWDIIQLSEVQSIAKLFNESSYGSGVFAKCHSPHWLEGWRDAYWVIMAKNSISVASHAQSQTREYMASQIENFIGFDTSKSEDYNLGKQIAFTYLADATRFEAYYLQEVPNE